MLKQSQRTRRAIAQGNKIRSKKFVAVDFAVSIITILPIRCSGLPDSQQRYDLMDGGKCAPGDGLQIGPRLGGACPSLPRILGCRPSQAAAWRFTPLQLRGGINHLAAYDIVQQAPRGITWNADTSPQSLLPARRWSASAVALVRLAVPSPAATGSRSEPASASTTAW